MKTQKPHYGINPETVFLKSETSKMLFVATLSGAAIYFSVLTFWFPRGSLWLFSLLVLGEIFHLWQAGSFIHTVWNVDKSSAKTDKLHQPATDVFITVAGEPEDVVEETAKAALAMDYPNFKVYILNDGKVAKKDNWRNIEILASRLKIACITRDIPGGAKAGNINYALKKTNSPLVAIFDADQVPKPEFLKEMCGFFTDSKMAFVQSPQYYKNFQKNEVAGGAWEQQELFFGPICKGKNRFNSAFMCGTNMVIRRSALEEAGGMCETNIAEDFLTSLFIHQNGWKSVYVPKVLARGLAPEDFLSYYKQQFRWARGSLEVLFKHNFLFRKRMSFNQEIQYMASASYYLSGVIVLINALFPLFFFYLGEMPLKISTMGLAAAFLPYIFFVLLSMRTTSNYTYTFRALAFSVGSFTVHLQALYAVITGQKSGFSVTAKKQLQGNFWPLVVPHLLYIFLSAAGIAFALMREGVTAALVTNASWSLFNIGMFMPFIIAANPDFFSKIMDNPSKQQPENIAMAQNESTAKNPRPGYLITQHGKPSASGLHQLSQLQKNKLTRY